MELEETQNIISICLKSLLKHEGKNNITGNHCVMLDTCLKFVTFN